MDYHSGKSRGFGFVNFKSPEVRQKVLSQVHYIQGRNCHVREPGSKVSTRPHLELVFALFCLLFNTVVVTMIIYNWISISCIGNNINFVFVSVSKALIICICICIRISDIDNLHLNQYQ